MKDFIHSLANGYRRLIGKPEVLSEQEAIITKEVIRRQCLVVSMISKAENIKALNDIYQSCQLFIEASFEPNYTDVPMAIIRSHYGWKKLELGGKPNDDVITERPLDDDKHD